MKLTTTTRTRYDGTIITETRNDLGLLHDPADGTPARIFIYANGNRAEEHRNKGALTDPADGTAAFICTYPDGAREEAHWKDGTFVSVRHIPAPGGDK